MVKEASAEVNADAFLLKGVTDLLALPVINAYIFSFSALDSDVFFSIFIIINPLQANIREAM